MSLLRWRPEENQLIRRFRVSWLTEDPSPANCNFNTVAQGFSERIRLIIATFKRLEGHMYTFGVFSSGQNDRGHATPSQNVEQLITHVTETDKEVK